MSSSTNCGFADPDTVAAEMTEQAARPSRENAELRAEVGALRETIDAAQEQVELMASETVYRGNSVGYWYGKAQAYGKFVDEYNAALRAAGMVFDGEKSGTQLIQDLTTERDILRARLDLANKTKLDVMAAYNALEAALLDEAPLEWWRLRSETGMWVKGRTCRAVANAIAKARTEANL